MNAEVKLLYIRLGVREDAAPEAIKAAYREMASRWHPDRVRGDKERFQSIQEAYDVLSDPERRAKYDATGDLRITPLPRVTAMEELAKMWLAVLEEPDFDVVRADFRAELEGRLQRAEENVRGIPEQLDRREARYRTALVRLRTKSGENGVLQSSLHAAIENVAKAKASSQAGLALLEEMRKVLAEYEYTPTTQAVDVYAQQSQGLLNALFGQFNQNQG